MYYKIIFKIAMSNNFYLMKQRIIDNMFDTIYDNFDYHEDFEDSIIEMSSNLMGWRAIISACLNCRKIEFKEGDIHNYQFVCDCH